jgi:hypothetical protein
MFRRRTETTAREDAPVYPAQRPMYGLTRAGMTLLGAAGAGLLIWLATQIDEGSNGGYWAVYGLIAAAGLVMALSQLLGGWTKWGVPRISANVFLWAFIPVLIVAGWVIVAGQPHPNWFRNHILNWSGDIHVRGLVNDLKEYIPVLAFGIGLVFGYTFDTSGPRLARDTVDRRREVVGTTPAYDRDVALGRRGDGRRSGRDAADTGRNSRRAAAGPRAGAADDAGSGLSRGPRTRPSPSIRSGDRPRQARSPIPQAWTLPLPLRGEGTTFSWSN